MRLTIKEYGCLLALMGKSRAEDPHTKVASVAITSDKRVIGISYNGLKAGAKIPKWMTLEQNRAKKGEYFIHAEKNLFALLKKGECYLLCSTISPCISCCQTILANGVKELVYIKEYHRCDKFKSFCKFHGIKCSQLSKKSRDNIKKYMNDMTNFEELNP